LEQIPNILSSQSQNLEANSASNQKITVYKVGEYVDISKGPMISNTSLIGRFEITGLFDIKSKNHGDIQRVQGVSIPKDLNVLNSFLIIHNFKIIIH
jgi:large subunit ribosomal protein L39